VRPFPDFSLEAPGYLPDLDLNFYRSALTPVVTKGK
jgi:hypothetical protein